MIGIIALLISILLPSLNKAREAAVRVQCASNLRQVGLYYQMYASRFKGHMPLGVFIHNGGWRVGASYTYARWGNWRGPMGVGHLFEWGIVDAMNGQQKVFWCPATPFPTFMMPNYDKTQLDNQGFYWGESRGNRWPWRHMWGGGYDSSKIGYSQRPTPPPVPGMGSTDPANDAAWSSGWKNELWWVWLMWDWGTQNVAGPDGFFGTIPRGIGAAERPYGGRGMFKVHELTNKAIMSDLWGGTVFVASMHKTGMNVLYGNGAVKFLPLEGLKPYLSTDPWRDEVIGVSGSSDFDWTTYTGPYMQMRLWAYFDLQ